MMSLFQACEAIEIRLGDQRNHRQSHQSRREEAKHNPPNLDKFAQPAILPRRLVLVTIIPAAANHQFGAAG
jgi:hypothetical protein